MRLKEIAFFTPDVKSMAGFYEKLLSLTPSYVSEQAAEFMLGDVKLFIHSRGDAPPASGDPPNEDHIAFEVENIGAACEELQSRGLTLEIGPKDYYWGRSAYLRDTDGRWLELHQRED